MRRSGETSGACSLCKQTTSRRRHREISQQSGQGLLAAYCIAQHEGNNASGPNIPAHNSFGIIFSASTIRLRKHDTYCFMTCVLPLTPPTRPILFLLVSSPLSPALRACLH
ncbi:unnamed protein product, partial [Ectocarpus sp. 8 AP-2014]